MTADKILTFLDSFKLYRTIKALYPIQFHDVKHRTNIVS